MEQPPGSTPADGIASDREEPTQATDDVRIIRDRGRVTTEALGYVPALDGLRGFALVGILFYHARFTWAQGSFLALSSFFTLSGFLITSIVLREWASSSTISIRSFWIRRFRRLLPAAWTTMALILVAGLAGLWNSDQLRALRGDVLFGLAEIINWHFIFADRSYGADFTAPSPMEHFWSLAVEEQFYFILPLVVTAILAVRTLKKPTTRQVRRLAAFLTAGVVVSAVLNGVLARRSIDRAYFGTDTRMAEILIGGLLAIVLLRRLRYTSRSVRVSADVAGIISLVAMVVMWHFVSLREEYMYPTGFLICAAITAAIIFAGLQGGLITKFLSLRVFVWAGKVSYGIYLIHWPVFVILSPARTGLPQVPLFLVRIVVTVAIATAMYHLIESPIRHRKMFPQRGFPAYSAVSVLVILALLGITTRDIPEPSEIDKAFRAPSSTTTIPVPQLRVLVTGDQTATDLAALIGNHPDMVVNAAPVPDCGLAIGGWVQMRDGAVERDVLRCRDSLDTWAEAITTDQPDFVLVSSTDRDTLPRRFEADSSWPVAGEELFESHVSGMFLDALESLDSAAETVAASVVAVSMPQGVYEPPVPAPPRTPVADANQEAALQDFDRELERNLPTLPDDAQHAERRRITTSILADTAELVGDRFLDLSTKVDELNGGPFRFTEPPQETSPTLGDDLADWLEADLREMQDAPPLVAPAPLDISSVTLPEAPPERPRRYVTPGQAPTFVVAGDSVAMSVTFGLGHWAEASGTQIHNATRLGCPIARGGVTKVQGDTKEYTEKCDWATEFADVIAAYRPNVVLLMSGVWEVTDRRLPGDTTYRHIGDPLMDRYILAEYLAAVDVLASDGATIALALQPHIESGRDKGFSGLPESDPARMDRFNELMHEVADLRPGVVVLVDVQGWTASQPGGEMSPDVRPDGVHFNDESSRALANWLGPQLTKIAEGP